MEFSNLLTYNVTFQVFDKNGKFAKRVTYCQSGASLFEVVALCEDIALANNPTASEFIVDGAVFLGEDKK